MSISQVIATVTACLEDPLVGLSARVAALADTEAEDPQRIRTEFASRKWKLAGVMQPSGQPNVMVRPGRWSARLKQANHRDGVVLVEIGAEWFDANVDVLQENITIAAAALAQVLDGLRAYSDAHSGTVIDVLDPIEYVFGEFTGPASSGFTATTLIEERSSQ
jgi:hypothetical protein